MPHSLDDASVLEALREFLNARFDIAAADVNPAAPLRDLGLDSMMVMDVMLETEDRYQTRFTDLALPRDPTVGDVVALVQRNVANAA